MTDNETNAELQAWFSQKGGALASSAFFLISWILTAALQPDFNTYTDVTYFAIAGVGLPSARCISLILLRPSPSHSFSSSF